MVTKSVLRKKKIAIALIVIVIISGILLSITLASNYIPKELTNIEKHNEKVEYFKTIKKEFSLVVYYPKLSGEVGANIKVVASKMADSLLENKDKIIAQNGNVKIKTDYSLSDVSNSILQFKMISSYLLEGSEVSQKTNTYFLDKQTGQIIETSTIFDGYLNGVLRQNLRRTAKMNGELGDIGYSRSFLEYTANTENLFTNFYIEDQEMVFNVDYENQMIEFRQSIAEIANHISIDLGISQLTEDPSLPIPVRYVNKDKPMVALTFDDGPHVTYTPEILEALRKYDSAATFFVLGNRIGDEGSKVIRNTIESGSEVGSHSWSHPYLPRTKNLDEEFYGTPKKVFEDVTNWVYEIKLFRPPYGSVSKKVSEFSPYPFIMWSIDTLDWQTRDAQTTVDTIMNTVKDGDIILMHDIHPESKDAAIQVIPMLIDQGYQLVTVSEMMSAKGISLENGSMYSKAR